MWVGIADRETRYFERWADSIYLLCLWFMIHQNIQRNKITIIKLWYHLIKRNRKDNNCPMVIKICRSNNFCYSHCSLMACSCFYSSHFVFRYARITTQDNWARFGDNVGCVTGADCLWWIGQENLGSYRSVLSVSSGSSPNALMYQYFF
jgi:hypothetical protein